MTSVSPLVPQPGDVIAGKYRIERMIGEGGMGMVFEARHQRLDERFALKVLHPSMLEHPELRERFEREARAAVKLRGRNVARVTDVDALPGGLPFMVMEFLEGQDLGQELEQRGSLPIGEAVDYVLQACSAMAEAHARGIVHRDLKPDNLFLAELPEGRCIKVLDFGISKSAVEGERSVTLTASMLGTPLYMSPEQVRSAKHVDSRTDIWSLGVILYEALTGRVPFPGESATGVAAAITADEYPALTQLRPDVPIELAQVVDRALRKPVELRCQSVEELAASLLPFAGQATAWTPPEPRSAAGPSRASAPGVATSAAMATAPTLQAAVVGQTQRGWARGERDPSTTQASRRRRWLVVAGALGVLAGSVAFAIVATTGAGSAPGSAATAPSAPRTATSGDVDSLPSTTSSETAAPTREARAAVSAQPTALARPRATTARTPLPAASPPATALVPPSPPTTPATHTPTVAPLTL